MKIGVFGGTFDPVHNAHIGLARCFYEKLGLDKILMIPAFVPPHKEGVMPADGEHRLKMCGLAAEDYSYIEVSDIELKRQGTSYTVDTLSELKERCPGGEFFLLMGADMFMTLIQWKNYEKILELSTVCAVMRDKSGVDALNKYKNKHFPDARVEIIDFSPGDVSSSMIRETVKSGKAAIGLVPEKVADYINENKLYYLGDR